MPSKLSRFFHSLRTRHKAKKEEATPNTLFSNLKQNNPAGSTRISLNPSEDVLRNPYSVSQIRRRLSVEGNHLDIDGVDGMDVEVDIPTPNDSEEQSFVGVYAGVSNKGYVPYNPRKVNQDSLLIREDLDTKTLILGTFDGHGEQGQFVSEFISNSFYNYITAHPQFATNLHLAAIESLAHAESDCLANPLIRTDFSGTTAVICLIRNTTLITLNVGDSRAILAKADGDRYQVEDLTCDHKPGLPEERARIEASGGRVFALDYDDGYVGPERVWLPDRDIPGLAMSRSLGDTIAHSVGVSSIPDVFERKITVDDRVIILGSDGLWEFISSEEAIKLIEECEQPEEAVEILGTTSWNRWFEEEKVVDDTTIIVVFLGKMDVQ